MQPSLEPQRLESLLHGIFGNLLTDQAKKHPVIHRILLLLSFATLFASTAALLSNPSGWWPLFRVIASVIALLAAFVPMVPKPVTADDWRAQSERFKKIKTKASLHFTFYEDRPWKARWIWDGNSDLNGLVLECTYAGDLLRRTLGTKNLGYQRETLAFAWLRMISRAASRSRAEEDGVPIIYGEIPDVVALSRFCCAEFELNPAARASARRHFQERHRTPLYLMGRLRRINSLNWRKTRVAIIGLVRALQRRRLE